MNLRSPFKPSRNFHEVTQAPRACFLGLSRSKAVSSSQRILLKHAECFHNLGWDVTVVTPRMPLPIDVRGIHLVTIPDGILRLSLRGGFCPFEILLKTATVVRRRFDLVYCMSGGHRPSQLLAACAAKLFRGSIVIEEWWEWMGGGGIASTRSGLFQWAVAVYDTLTELKSKRLFDGIVAISDGLKNRISPGTNCIILYGAVDIDSMKPMPKTDARRALGLSDEEFIVGMSNVCEQDHLDNVPFLIALSNVMKHDHHVRLVATTCDRQYFMSRLMEFFPNNRVNIIDWETMEGYRTWLSACDVFALPFPETRRNIGRWPNKFGDFVCLERPIITNPTGAVGSIVQKYGIGVVCPHNSGAYEKALLTIRLSSFIPGAFAAAREEIPDFVTRANQIVAFYHRLKKRVEQSRKLRGF